MKQFNLKVDGKILKKFSDCSQQQGMPQSLILRLFIARFCENPRAWMEKIIEQEGKK